MQSNLIVPQTVLEAYLVGYTQRERTELQTAYETILQTISKGVKPNKQLLMTAGAEGVGKSTYLRGQVEERAAKGTKFALIDWDNIIRTIPSFQTLQSTLHDYFGNVADANADRETLNESKKWIKGAKWIGDMLLNDMAHLGLPIAFETTAHNPNIEKFLQAFKDAGYTIDIHYGDAPLQVKIASAHTHAQTEGGAVIDDQTIIQKSAGIRGNMATLALYADSMTLLWRAGLKDKLTAFAQATKGGAIKTMNADARGKFNKAGNAEQSITIEEMLRIVKTEAQALAFTTTRTAKLDNV